MFRKSSYSGPHDDNCVEVDTDWHKSSHSLTESSCVETHCCDGGVWVRDSKDPTGAVLKFTAGEWDAFLAGAKDGEFDRGERA